MSVANTKDFWAGVFFVLCGAFFVYFSQENEMGSAARMGPAYFPTLVGGLLGLLGAVIAIKSLFFHPKNSSDGKIDACDWRSLLLILGSVLVFSLLLAYCGLMLSLAAMIAVAALADKTSRVKETIVLIVILDLLAWVIFVYGIGMLVPVWPVLGY